MKRVIALGLVSLFTLGLAVALPAQNREEGGTGRKPQIRERIIERLHEWGLPEKSQRFGRAWGFQLWMGPGGMQYRVFPGPGQKGEWRQGFPFGMPLLGRMEGWNRLGLTEAQRKELAEAFAAAARDRFMILTDPDLRPAERAAKLQGVRARLRAAFEKVLTPEQREKLRNMPRFRMPEPPARRKPA